MSRILLGMLMSVSLAVGISACGSDGNSTLAASSASDSTAVRTVGTTMLSEDVFEVNDGVDFRIGSAGSRHYLFSWSDAGGEFVDVRDPTLILRAGQTYTFQRTSAKHPLQITTDWLPVEGKDGSFDRTTNEGLLIDLLTLQPLEDFKADPAPTDDIIEWTPSEEEVGGYFYTCRVVRHGDMTGAIRVRADDASPPVE